MRSRQNVRNDPADTRSSGPKIISPSGFWAIDPASVSIVDKFAAMDQVLRLTVNVVLIAAVLLAVYQILQIKKAEKAEAALNGLNNLYSVDVIKAQERLGAASQLPPNDRPILEGDVSLLSARYENLAALYSSGLADKCMIKDGAKPQISQIVEIGRRLANPPEQFARMEKFLIQLEKERCD